MLNDTRMECTWEVILAKKGGDHCMKRQETFLFDRSTKNKHRFYCPEDDNREPKDRFGVLYVPKSWFPNPQQIRVTIEVE